MTKRHKTPSGFFARHSLTIVVFAIWLLWLMLYSASDPQTHLGSLFGNSIADWLGMLAFVVATKYFSEVGSKESREPRPHWHNRLWDSISRHSLSLVIIGTGVVWAMVYARSDPDGRAGQVYGNIVSEWGQLLALVLMTKYFREEGSKES